MEVWVLGYFDKLGSNVGGHYVVVGDLFFYFGKGYLGILVLGSLQFQGLKMTLRRMSYRLLSRHYRVVRLYLASPFASGPQKAGLVLGHGSYGKLHTQERIVVR